MKIWNSVYVWQFNKKLNLKSFDIKVFYFGNFTSYGPLGTFSFRRVLNKGAVEKRSEVVQSYEVHAWYVHEGLAYML